MSKLKTAAVTLTLLTLTATQVHAALVSRNILKSFFVPGAKPTSAQFSTLIDSTLNINDDNLILFGVGITSDATGSAALECIPRSPGSRNPDRSFIDSTITFGPESNEYPIPPFWSGNDGFLPLEFVDAANQPHYGFLDMQMAPFTGDPDTASIFVNSFSYESTPNTAIALPVPEPTTLSLLALTMIPALFRRRPR